MKWRLLGVVVLALALAWSGWWWIGASTKQAALGGWLDDRRAEGWQAEAADIAVSGFPNRFDTRISELALADPAQGWAWRAPFLDILMLSYAPNRAVLALPPEQWVAAAPGASATLRSEGLRASIRFAPGRSLSVTRLSAEAGLLALEGEGWSAATGPAQAHVRASEPGTAPENGYDLFFAAEGVTPPDDAAEALEPVVGLPERLDSLTLDARVAFDRPLDRRAVEVAPPQVLALSIKALEARWGALSLGATGSVRADAQGYAEGRIDLRARNWRAMLRAAAQAGALDRGVAQALEAALSIAAALSGDGETLEVPLRLTGGAAMIGPVRVGRAPRMIRP